MKLESQRVLAGREGGSSPVRWRPLQWNVSHNNSYQDEDMESITSLLTNSTFLRTMSIYIIDRINGPNQSIIYNMKKQKIHTTL